MDLGYDVGKTLVGVCNNMAVVGYTSSLSLWPEVNVVTIIFSNDLNFNTLDAFTIAIYVKKIIFS